MKVQFSGAVESGPDFQGGYHILRDIEDPDRKVHVKFPKQIELTPSTIVRVEGTLEPWKPWAHFVLKATTWTVH